MNERWEIGGEWLRRGRGHADVSRDNLNGCFAFAVCAAALLQCLTALSNDSLDNRHFFAGVLRWNGLVRLIKSLCSFSRNDHIRTWQLKERVRKLDTLWMQREDMHCLFLSCLTRLTHYQIHRMTASVWLAAVVNCGIRGIRNFCLMSLNSWFPRNVGTNRKFAMTKYSTLISYFAFSLLS